MGIKSSAGSPRSTASSHREVLKGVRDVVAALRRSRPSLGEELAQEIFDHDPAFANAGVESAVIEGCRANTAIALDYMARGVPLESIAPTAEVIELTRDLVREGVPLPSITRSYNVAVYRVIEVWTDTVAASRPADRESLEIVKLGTRYLLTWRDRVVDRLSAEYRIELERRARERTLARVDDVRRVLTEADMDEEAVGVRLGYRLGGSHIAMVLREDSPAPDGSAVQSAVRELSNALGTSGALSVRVDVRTTWCWLPSPQRGYRKPVQVSAPVLAAIGRPAAGLAGFRRSHREALDALRVAETIARRAAGTVTHYEDVDIAAMCSIQAERYHEFIKTELRDLAANDGSTLRIRETLIAFYAANSNYRATGVNLGIHHNTVRYRLDQAALALGHDIDERRLAVELALHLAQLVESPGGDETSVEGRR